MLLLYSKEYLAFIIFKKLSIQWQIYFVYVFVFIIIAENICLYMSDGYINDGNEIHYNGSYYNNDDENIVFELCSDGLFLHFYNTDENPLSVIHHNLPECHVMREVFGFDMSVLSSVDAEALIDIVGGNRDYGYFDPGIINMTEDEFSEVIERCRGYVRNINRENGICGRCFLVDDGHAVVSIWWDDNPNVEQLRKICGNLSREYNISYDTFLIALPHGFIKLGELSDGMEIDDIGRINDLHQIHNLPPKEKHKKLQGWMGMHNKLMNDKLAYRDHEGNIRTDREPMTMAQYHSLIYQENVNNNEDNIVGMKKIRLNEHQFRSLINESVKIVLNELLDSDDMLYDDYMVDDYDDKPDELLGMFADDIRDEDEYYKDLTAGEYNPLDDYWEDEHNAWEWRG